MIAASLTLAGLAGGPPGLAAAGAALVVGWTSAALRRPREPAAAAETAVGSTVVGTAR